VSVATRGDRALGTVAADWDGSDAKFPGKAVDFFLDTLQEFNNFRS